MRWPRGATSSRTAVPGASPSSSATPAWRCRRCAEGGCSPHLMPPGVRPDVHEGTTYVGLVPFRMVDAGPGRRTSVPWAGTFHAIGARLIRDYAETIGLDPQFTIHDRDKADPRPNDGIPSMTDTDAYSPILPSDVGWVKRPSKMKPYYNIIHIARCRGISPSAMPWKRTAAQPI